MIIYMCIKLQSNTPILSKDIARKPKVLRTGWMDVRRDSGDTIYTPIENGGGLIKQRVITPKVRKPELSILYVTSHLILIYNFTKYHQNIPKGIQLTERTRSFTQTLTPTGDTILSAFFVLKHVSSAFIGITQPRQFHSTKTYPVGSD